MAKDRPTELHKIIKRLKYSRDQLKELSREKTSLNKKLRDRNVELTTNRDYWRDKCSESEDAQQKLNQTIQACQEEVERERRRVQSKSEHAEQLKLELSALREKKSRS